MVHGLGCYGDPLLVTASAVASTHLLRGPLLCPACFLCVRDSLPCSGTEFTFLGNDKSGGLLRSIAGKQGASLFELSDFGVNRSKNIVYGHAKSISTNCSLLLRSQGAHCLTYSSRWAKMYLETRAESLSDLLGGKLWRPHVALLGWRCRLSRTKNSSRFLLTQTPYPAKLWSWGQQP